MKARALKLGDTIGIIAPASPTNPEEQEQALEIFSEFGFNLKLGNSLWQQHGYLAGHDWNRAEDLNRMFADPEVDAIFCMRGGYGTPRILDLIDYRGIRKNPKIFVGYSDITALHLAIHRFTGLVTFHGPMITELARKPDFHSWSTLFQHLTSHVPVARYEEPIEKHCIVVGSARGPLIGGNLSLLVSTLGTPFEIDTTGKILFIEDVDEDPYRVDRMLTQLRHATKLQNAAGIVFTDFTDCTAENGEKSLTIREILDGIVKPLGIPCYYGLNVGHTQPNWTLPIGVLTEIDALEGWIQFQEGSVESLEG
ncbi:muramoyltetrapeptide carboxypeptidase [Thermoactinomyces sp. DSM 45891]|uniref:S66 peptidase family protein n=1 Tax=Thermoactinomyces sp. DSM 45891 TaxID=1761907 RepID=UPI000915165D|nr:LD-carboxypeptidase [Thermoactinomyces sp. DSM 45891]SFX49792.1 muramoyltetrapeptide carboxypeptidase [Thermoactinomyces sp. DSM 45891]